MNIREVMNQIDQLFDENKPEQACEQMEVYLESARQEKDWGAELSLLNELMGYYRHVGILEKAKSYAKDAVSIVEKQHLEESVDGATTYLNVATVYRVCREYEKAMKLYKQVEQIYQGEHLENDFRLGGLYNNMCVAHLELGRWEEALSYGEKALVILKHFPEAQREYQIVSGNVEEAKKRVK